MKHSIIFKLSNSQNLISSVLLAFIISGCSFPPINSTFDSAKTLGKGNIEIAGNYSKYIIDSYQFSTSKYSSAETKPEFNNFGLRIGLGAADKLDIKFRYERITRNGNSLNYFELNPKFSTEKNKRAFSIPIGIYQGDFSSLVVLSPKFLFTIEASDKFEFNYSLKADIFPSSISSILLGINCGAGFSNNLNEWAIRPEIGFMISPSEFKPIWTYGIGFSYIIPKK